MKQVFFTLFFSVTFFLSAQKTDEDLLREKIVTVHQSQIQIDTFSIQPYYFDVLYNDISLPSTQYRVDFVNAVLYLNDYKKYKEKKLVLKYWIYPEELRKTYQKMKPIATSGDSIKSLVLHPGVVVRERQPFEGLQTQGSITRAINAGNQQSLVMVSGLDLKIEGKLSDKISLKAVLSDDNLPQAYAGISQSYKEFNKIYMQLKSPSWETIGGDILMKEESGYFLKFTRKTQGLSIKYGDNNSQLQVTAAYVEGKFTINRFNGIEGNQGPYPLKGNNNEPYIFVVPDSEKVYVNGVLLKNGEKGDYVINYETAEIRFNPTFPITNNHRIVVEFNYSNQHYVRYLNYNKYKQQSDKLSWSVMSFIEGDVKSQTLLYDLNEQQIQNLKNAGDDLQKTWMLAAVPTTYDENKILYKKIHLNNNFYFEYEPNEAPDLYEVKFSYVGTNKGNYKIQKVIATGKIYEYVGENNGDYIPYIQLTPPERKIYTAFNAVYLPNENTILQIETVTNFNDKNTFSSIDDNNNVGGAVHTNWEQVWWKNSGKQLKSILNYDFVHSNFVQLKPFRSPEFNRQWQVDSIFGKQNLLDVSFVYQTKRQIWQSGYRFFKMRDSINTHQLFTKAELNAPKWKAKADFEWNQRKGSAQIQAHRLHQILQYLPTNHLWTIEIFSDKKDKSMYNLPDSLNYHYRYMELNWKRKDTLKWKYEMYVRKEVNDSIHNYQWNVFQTTNILGGNLQHHYPKGFWQFFARYSNNKYVMKDSLRHYINLSTKWRQYYFKRFLESEMALESYNGNTLRNEVVFVETPPGQGIYLWNDYNQNGIKEINEFEVATFSDQARYIKVVLPSKNYLQTLNNKISLNLSVNPGVWKKGGVLKRIYGMVKYQANHETTDTRLTLQSFFQPKNTLLQNELWQQDWFLNRGRKKYKLHFTYQFLKQQQLLYVGLQSRQLERYLLTIQHSFLSNWQWQQKIETGNEVNFSENYATKNYNIKQSQLNEQLLKRWQKNTFALYINYAQKKNLNAVEELKKYELGMRYYQLTQKQNLIDMELSFVQNNMKGDAASPVAFQMLEGLQKGKNVIFKSIFQQKLKSYLILNLNYSFRLSEKKAMVHTGGVQLKMVF